MSPNDIDRLIATLECLFREQTDAIVNALSQSGSTQIVEPPQSVSEHAASATESYLPIMGCRLDPSVLTEIRSHKELSNNRSTIETNGPGKYSFKEVPVQSGELPTHWLVPCINAKSIWRFTVHSAMWDLHIIPMSLNSDLLNEKNAEAEAFWRKLCRHYLNSKESGPGPNTLWAQIANGDRMQKLLEMRRSEKLAVAVNLLGEGLFAGVTVVSPNKFEVGLIPIQNHTEGHYLCVLLNAPSTIDLAKRNQSGKRYRSVKFWQELGLVRFDPQNDAQARLAAIGQQVHDVATTIAAQAKNRKKASQKLYDSVPTNLLREWDSTSSEILNKSMRA